MNLNLFDTADGIVLRERENVFREPAKRVSAYTDSSVDNSPFPPHTPIGMAYVPYQDWGTVQAPEDALRSGSLFAELVYPFEGGGVMNSGGGK